MHLYLVNGRENEKNAIDRDNLDYPGRIWTNEKYISFWYYPPVDKFKEIIKNIEDYLGIDIMNDRAYKVEALQSKKTNEIKTSINPYNYDPDNKPVFIHPKKYIGSEERSKKELEKQHELSPLLKKQKTNDGGFGANKYANKKPLPLRQAMYAENKEEELYPRLNESPDRFINGTRWDAGDAIAFGYYDETLYFGKGLMHYQLDVPQEKDLGRDKLQYPGRIWTEEKVISFWTYPSIEDFEWIIIDLENNLGINILDDPEFKIEVVIDDNEKIEKGGNFKYDSNSKLIPIKDYVGSKNRSEEELKKAHELSPLLKGNRNVGNFGANKYADKKPLPLRQAMYTEDKEEEFYPTLKS
jgi:hypothetical protein